MRTGDLRPFAADPTVHLCRMFRWTDLEGLLERSGGWIVDGSASNWVSLGDPELLARLEADDERWSQFIEHEVAACQQPGARDGGAHVPFFWEPPQPEIGPLVFGRRAAALKSSFTADSSCDARLPLGRAER